MVSLRELDGRFQRINWKLTALAVALYALGVWLVLRGQYEGAATCFASASGWVAQAHWDWIAGRRPPDGGEPFVQRVQPRPGGSQDDERPDSGGSA